MKKVLNMETWMLLVVILLTACSDNSGGSSEEKEDCFLNIYVYAPGHPMLTRADVGEIAARSEAEHQVKTLQIWVFKHSDDSLVGYLDATPTFLNETDGHEMFRMKVSRAFADHPENVDVYVVANAASVGLASSLKESTTRSELDAKMIGENYFGIVKKEGVENCYIPGVSEVPADGLPMSGVERNQPIYGSYPTLRVGTQDAMTTVQLTRAISKLRFVLCRVKEEDNAKKILVSVDNIQLDEKVIPTASYLMPKETPSYTSYVLTAVDYGNVEKATIPQVDNPMIYIYEKQAAQEYEDLINSAVTATPKQLMQLGLTYLRESDKKLTGTITYKTKEREDIKTKWDAITQTNEETAHFSMALEGDFLRNHSWIVYIYFMDGKIHVLTVTDIGMKAWVEGDTDTHDVYNW